MSTGGMGVAVILAALVVLGLIMTTRSLADPGPRLVRFVEFACVVIIVVAIFGGGATVVASLSGGPTTVEVPLAVHTPGVILPKVVLDKPPATIVAGGADHATLTVTGLSWTCRLLLAAGTAIQVTVIVMIAWTMRRLARNLRSNAPFSQLSRPMFRLASILFAGGLLWAFVAGTGSYLAGQEALQIQGWGTDAGFPWPDLPLTVEGLAAIGWPEPASWSVTVPWTPLAAALGLALLGLACRAGERMQADTAGLV